MLRMIQGQAQEGVEVGRGEVVIGQLWRSDHASRLCGLGMHLKSHYDRHHHCV